MTINEKLNMLVKRSEYDPKAAVFYLEDYQEMKAKKSTPTYLNIILKYAYF